MTTTQLTAAAAAGVLAGAAWMSAAGATATATPTTASTTASTTVSTTAWTTAPALVPAPPVSGTLDDSGRRILRIAQDGVELRVRAETTVLTTELVYQPGQESGWHSHPGIVIAVVREGAVVRQSVDRRGRCVSETFTAGDAFYEVGPHFVSNPGDAPALLRITRVFPADMTTPRLEERAPDCR